MTSSSLRSSDLLVLFLNQWNLLILLCKLTIDDKIQSSFPLFPIFFLVDIIILYACNCQIYLLPCSPVSYIHLHAQAPTSISNSIWNLTSCKINLYLFSCCCFPIAKSCLLFVTSWTAARQASPSFTIWVCSNLCPWNWWCHPTISSFATHFSSFPQFSPVSGFLQWVSSSHWVAKVYFFHYMIWLMPSSTI